MLKAFKINYFLLFTIFIFSAFPTMCFAVGKRVMPIGLIFAIIVFLLLSLKPRQILKDVYNLTKFLSTKILICFGIWAIISAVFVSILYGISLIKMLFSIFLAIVLSMLLPYFLSFVTAKRFNIKLLVKFYTIILYTILLFGLIDFVIYYFKIYPLTIWYNATIINARLIKMGVLSLDFNMYKDLGIFPRAQSVFEEPSHFAWFICLNIPIILSLCTSKYKLFKNNVLNLVIKKTMIPIMYTVLVMTQSPINIIFGIFISFASIIKKIKINYKHMAALLLVAVIIISLGFYFVANANPDQKVLYRIQSTLSTFTSFENLITAEKSLGTRLVYYALMFKVFLKNMIFGCGWANSGIFMYHQISEDSIPLTEEIYTNYLRSTASNFTSCITIFFRTAAETGLIGVCLLFAFLLKIKKYARILYNNSTGIIKDYFYGVDFLILLYIIMSFYDSNLYIEYFWFIFGLVVETYRKLRINRKNVILANQSDFCQK